jgi:hypothetical protein
MCVMAQNQNHSAPSQSISVRQALELKSVKASGLVPGNKKPAQSVAVAIQLPGQLVSIVESGNRSVVATPAFGFGRAPGGPSTQKRAAHITKPSTGRGVTSGPAKPGWFCGRAG